MNKIDDVKIKVLLFLSLLVLGGCQLNNNSSDSELKRDAQLEQPDPLTHAVVRRPDLVQSQPKTKPNIVQPTHSARDSDGDCSQLSQQQCLNSRRCLLDQNSKKAYFCRAATDNCEMDFVQAGEKLKRSCLSKGKCYYQGASCFCPPGVACICGGGQPAMCSAKVIDDSPLQ